MAYDPAEYDWSADPEPEQPAAAPLHVPASVLPSAEGQPEELDEVERRLEKAHYYRMLLKHQLISSDSDEAIEVENEIQDFVRERLAILLGIKMEKAFNEGVSTFTPEEVEALRAVAAKVLNRPTIVQASAPAAKPAPTIKPLTEKPAPAVRPAQSVVEAPKAVTPPPAPVKRGRGRPRKNPAPVAAAAPLAKSEPAATPAPKQELKEGERIETIGGKRYKVVSRVVNDPATGQPKLDSNGKPIMGEHRIDITPKATIPGRQPFPSLEVANAMEAAKAAEVLSANPIAAGLIPTAMTLPDTTQKD